MKCTGYYHGANLTLDGELTLTMSLNDKVGALEQINSWNKEKLMDIEINPHRKKRSLDANALLWACVGDISKALGVPKERIYLRALRDYGQYEMMACKKSAVGMFARQYKACEQIGYDYEMNGEAWVNVICYFGSHTYDTKQFSDLLEGVIGDMRELGLQPPPPRSIQKGLELWQQTHQKEVSAT